MCRHSVGRRCNVMRCKGKCSIMHHRFSMRGARIYCVNSHRTTDVNMDPAHENHADASYSVLYCVTLLLSLPPPLLLFFFFFCYFSDFYSLILSWRFLWVTNFMPFLFHIQLQRRHDDTSMQSVSFSFFLSLYLQMILLQTRLHLLMHEFFIGYAPFLAQIYTNFFSINFLMDFFSVAIATVCVCARSHNVLPFCISVCDIECINYTKRPIYFVLCHRQMDSNRTLDVRVFTFIWPK